mgnify:CR=1 FL=1
MWMRPLLDPPPTLPLLHPPNISKQRAEHKGKGRHILVFCSLEMNYFWHEKIEAEGIPIGHVVGLRGDFTPNSMAILFALIENQNIIVPFDYQQSTNHTDKYQIAKVQTLISVDRSSKFQIWKF